MYGKRLGKLTQSRQEIFRKRHYGTYHEEATASIARDDCLNGENNLLLPCQEHTYYGN